eukprot:1860478-Alexandrium_andersonii.AAC.1
MLQGVCEGLLRGRAGPSGRVLCVLRCLQGASWVGVWEVLFWSGSAMDAEKFERARATRAKQ